MKTAPKSLYIALASSLLVFGISFGAFAVDAFDAMAVISSTMGANANRLCAAEASRGDLGCPTVAPYISFTTGRIGLGTTAPSSTLHVVGTADTVGGTDSSGGLTIGTSAGPRIAINPYGSGSAEIRNLTGGNIAFTDYLGQIIFSTIAGQNYVITANGMGVGLGSSLLNLIPSTTLQVSGSIRISQDASATTNTCDANRAGSIRYNGTEFQTCFGSGGWATLASAAISGTNVSGGDKIVSGTTNVTANTSGYVSFTTGGVVTSYMNTAGLLITPGISATTNRTSVTSLYASGNVGFGTTAQGSPLRVGALTNPVIVIQDLANVSSSNSVQGWLSLKDSNNVEYGWMGDGSSGANFVGMFDTRPLGEIRLGAGSSVAAMTIVSSGNVGIGTAVPSSSLHVYATTQPVANFTSTNTDYAGVNFENRSLPSQAAGSQWAIIINGSTPSSLATYPTGSFMIHQHGAGPRLVISPATGNVGIGTSNPGTSRLAVTGPDGGYAVYGAGDPGDAAIVGAATGGGWGIYCSSTACGGTSAWNNTSDRRLKQDIVSLETRNTLEALMKLRPVTFYWRDAEMNRLKGKQYGFIAQEVEEVFPQMVTTGLTSQTITLKDGSKVSIDHPKTLDYATFVVPLTKAVQELKVENDSLKARLDVLEKRLEAVEKK